MPRELIDEAAEAIERLTKERDEARQESLDNYGQGIKRGASQMRERAAKMLEDYYGQYLIAKHIRAITLEEESK
jgi:uncharacterized protein YcnI